VLLKAKEELWNEIFVKEICVNKNARWRNKKMKTQVKQQKIIPGIFKKK
jgi:hypothetical protein